jgi:phosphatidylinositol-3-phosphatase
VRLRGAPRALLALALALLALAPAGARAATPLPPIKHVFIIVLENKSFDETFGALSPAPYLSQSLPSMGALLPNYYGVTHLSLGNYIALVSGQGSNPVTQTDCQVYMDVLPGSLSSDGQASGVGCVYPSAVKTVADQLDAAGLSWKGYMEDMGNGAGQPATCRHPAFGSADPTQTARPGDQYAARHNPFVYFHSLLDSGACARDDVPLDRLPADLASTATTPNYSFITPNLCDDGHDAKCADGRTGGLPAVDAFLKQWVPRILASPAYRADGLLAILFDEADGSDASACCNEPQFPNTPNNGGLFPGRGGGRTGAVLLSPFIDPGTVDSTAYNHFGMLRSVEDLFGLGHLGYAGVGGLQSLGADAFTCYAPTVPQARRGVLPRDSEIKLALFGRDTNPRPLLEVKLWHPGRVTVQVRSRKRHARWRSLGRPQQLAACQLLKLRLPYRHGKVRVSARAFGGVERRTLSF